MKDKQRCCDCIHFNDGDGVGACFYPAPYFYAHSHVVDGEDCPPDHCRCYVEKGTEIIELEGTEMEMIEEYEREQCPICGSEVALND